METTKTNEWTPSKPLPRGATLWRVVVAMMDDGTEVSAPALGDSEARFKILERRTAESLDKKS